MERKDLLKLCLAGALGIAAVTTSYVCLSRITKKLHSLERIEQKIDILENYIDGLYSSNNIMRKNLNPPFY
jgi:hypothetical protein